MRQPPRGFATKKTFSPPWQKCKEAVKYRFLLMQEQRRRGVARRLFCLNKIALTHNQLQVFCREITNQTIVGSDDCICQIAFAFLQF